MHLRNILLLLVLGCIALFAAVNWSAIMAPTTLSFIFATVQAPLGLILLAATAVLAVLFLAFIVTMQTSVMMETRRLHKEVENQRKLADQAEASRFTELHNYLGVELGQLAQQNASTATSMEDRLRQTGQELRTSVEQTGNTMMAALGEIDDRLQRNSTQSVPVRPIALDK